MWSGLGRYKLHLFEQGVEGRRRTAGGDREASPGASAVSRRFARRKSGSACGDPCEAAAYLLEGDADGRAHTDRGAGSCAWTCSLRGEQIRTCLPNCGCALSWPFTGRKPAADLTSINASLWSKRGKPKAACLDSRWPCTSRRWAPDSTCKYFVAHVREMPHFLLYSQVDGVPRTLTIKRALVSPWVRKKSPCSTPVTFPCWVFQDLTLESNNLQNRAGKCHLD